NEPTGMTATFDTDSSTCGTCDGGAKVNVSGGTPSYSYDWIGESGSGDTLGDICAGGYSVEVTDANNCIDTFSTTISDKGGDTLSTSVTQTTCSDTCDGTATVDFDCSTGAGTCSIKWFDSDGVNINEDDQETADSLCPGTYFVRVENGAGCVTVDTAVVPSPLPFDISADITDADCNGSCNGEIDVSISGSNGAPYDLQWFNGGSPIAGETSSTLSDQCAGTYTLEIVDVLGCDTSVTYEIKEPTTLNVDSFETENNSCAGECLGEAEVHVSGGVAPYNYQWKDSDGNMIMGETESDMDSLCSGDYIVEITDDLGCSITDTTTITEPDTLEVTTSTTSSTCGNDDGSATANPTGGTTSYDYQWGVDADNQTTQTADNLEAGTYTVTVTDANGCQEIANASVSDIGGETVSLDSVDVTCPGDSTGKAITDFTCADPPCTFKWEDNTGDSLDGGTTSSSPNTDTLENLPAGKYNFTVENNSGCITSKKVNIDETNNFEDNESITEITCNGACDGRIDVSPTGGNGDYTYDWYQNGSAFQLNGLDFIDNLCAANYALVVTDSSGCSSDTFRYNLTQPDLISVDSFEVNNVSCAGQCDGDAEAFVSGGTSPYSYQWKDISGTNISGETDSIIEDTCEGDYIIEITDANGCSGEDTATITVPDSIFVSTNTTEATCGDCNGTAYVDSISGGTSPYNYLWTPSNDVTDSATGLCQGIYQLTVTDDNGCQETVEDTVDEILAVPTTTDSIPVTCPGDSDGQAIVNYTCNDAPCTVTWKDFEGNPIGQSTDTATGLAADTFIVDVENNSGCTETDTAIVTEPDPIVDNPTVENNVCANDCQGKINVNPSGGNDSPYSFEWYKDGSLMAGETDDSITTLCNDSFAVVISDDSSCASDTFEYEITAPNSLVVDSTNTIDASCADSCDGEASVYISGGTPSYSYQWMDPSGSPMAGETDSTISGLCDTIYQLQVTDDNNCDTLIDVTIGEPSQLEVTIDANDATCGICDGIAEANPTGGTPGYDYQWDDPESQTTKVADSLCPG
ncbi:MAG: SprB repeat-containing protein, partial [Flavobacteriales bacterium]